MSKPKSFAAKLAHATESKKKELCPICNSEVKIIKIIRNRLSKGKWSPKKEIVKVCKCNEKELLA